MTSYTARAYAALYAADTVRLAQAAALIRAGQGDAAVAALRGVVVRTWAKEWLIEGLKEAKMQPTRQTGDDHYSRRTPEKIRRGPDAPGAKLRADDIEAMCAEWVRGSMDKAWLGRKYGVSRITVWRHLKARGLVTRETD